MKCACLQNCPARNAAGLRESFTRYLLHAPMTRDSHGREKEDRERVRRRERETERGEENEIERELGRGRVKASLQQHTFSI